MIALALALQLLQASPDVAGARTVEVSGDIVVTIAWSAKALATEGAVDVNLSGDTLTLAPAGGPAGRDVSVSFGTQKLQELVVKGGARVVVQGFAGKALDIKAAGGSQVSVSGGPKGADTLRITGSGTSRVDADGLTVDSADVTLKDAARAEVKATKSLTCDLQRAARLVVKGKPAQVDKKLAGVAKLDFK